MEFDRVKLGFGARVRYYRKQRGLSQEQLARGVGRNTETISNIERGVTSTRLETANAIAAVLEIPLCDLFFESPEEEDYPKRNRRLLDTLIGLAEREEAETIDAIIAVTQILLRLKKGGPDRRRR